MRLWSIHPNYLDRIGLVACWREALLAKKVLQGRTKGYKRHPQLERFSSVAQIDSYLYYVREEACKRSYRFDGRKVGKRHRGKLKIAKGQLEYEFKHLMGKLRTRDPDRWEELRKLRKIEPHPLFKEVPGGIASWEKVSGSGSRT